MDSKIQEYFETACQSLKAEFSEQRLLGVFAYGAFNYNLIEKPEELQVVAIYLPTLDELCTSLEVKKYSKMIGPIKTYIRDIRYGYECAKAESSIFMEVLVTDLYWVNPRYAYHYNLIRENSEEILHINKRGRLNVAYAQALKNLELYENSKNSYYLQQAVRLQLAIDSYMRGNPCAECVRVTEESQLNYLKAVKNNPESFDMNGLRRSFDRTKMKIDLEDNRIKVEVLQMFRDNLKRTMILSMKKSQDVGAFLSTLTSSERTALAALVNLRDEKNNITVIISDLTTKIHVSYPVIKSLFQKLEKVELAAITNRGTKGTVVQILNQELINKMEDDYDEPTL